MTPTFGCRNDSPIFNELNQKFYTETFFPILKDRGINTIIQTGDLFDRRKYINFNSLYKCREYFFDQLYPNNLHLITYLGNHDVYHKNTSRVNSPQLLLAEYLTNDVDIVSLPSTYTFGGVDMDFIPWICEENEDVVKKFIERSKSQICFGHFELTGFEMDAGNPCIHGMDRGMLQGYDMVLSGHFHHRSTDGHIFYVGSPHEMTWADYDDPRGFHIFNTETRELEFIENPNKVFYKITYDDTNETLQTIDNKDYGEFKDKYVKVIVEKKTSHMLFDKFINNFYVAEPADLNIVEDFTDYSKVGNLMDDTVDQAQQTPVLLDRYVDAVEIPVEKARMKAVMRDLYNKAKNKEPA